MAAPARRVAVVTGSNKGLGLEIVRRLCQEFDGDVLLTARNESRGLAAVESLKQQGLHPVFHQLDITQQHSVETLAQHIRDVYKGLDLLVNNAAILYLDDSTEPLGVQARETMRVNYFSNLDVCQVLFPLLRPHARVVNMSSLGCAFAYTAVSPEVKARLTDPHISMEQLSHMMTQFVESVEAGSHTSLGYHLSSEGGLGVYSMSKAGLTVMTAIQQRMLEADGADDIVVNCVSPGYVNTDMTAGKGTLTVEEGAVTPLYCCLLPHGTDIRGHFLRDKVVYDWTQDSEHKRQMPVGK